MEIVSPAYIYALCDPSYVPEGSVFPPAEHVRYVGKTNNLRLRLRNHLVSKSATHCANWLRSLRAAGQRPVSVILETVADGMSWEEREQWWIAYYRSSGAALTNLTSGGDRGRIPSPEVRAKLSAAQRARIVTPEEMARRVAGKRAALADPERRTEIRRHMSAVQKVNTHNTERLKTRWDDPEWRAATMAQMKLAAARPEVQAKRQARAMAQKAETARKKAERAAQPRRKHPPPTPQAFAAAIAANTGKKRTPEQRARMSEARRRNL